MCGIFGWDFKPGKDVSYSRRLIIATVLAQSNERRGGDSWGVYIPDKGFKRGLDNAVCMPLTEMAKANTVMCHTRKATSGAKTKKNAHPFEIGDIIGAHNGIISNHDELNKKYSRDFDVDSMHLFAHLNEGKSFDDIRGYGAIEYIKNGERGRFHVEVA